jgi:hypothetical protein
MEELKACPYSRLQIDHAADRMKLAAINKEPSYLWPIDCYVALWALKNIGRAEPENKAQWIPANKQPPDFKKRNKILVSDGSDVVQIYASTIYRDGNGNLRAPAKHGAGIAILYWMLSPEPPYARKPEGNVKIKETP